MRRLYTLLILICPCLVRPQTYWQQQVDYKIDVSLNDVQHELNGFISINYTNNSPDTLRFIYFHLWPNAYKDQSTPFAKQMMQDGNTSFWFSRPSDKGYIDSILFKANDELCNWKFDSGSIEICRVFLNKPLAPGGIVKITTPFHVKIPENVSRLGHVRQSYQISQWYPKPAVYDKNGWHPFPYLDQGEFYSEFGSFDVSITLPENYVVGATGELQDSSEIEWMSSKAATMASYIKTNFLRNLQRNPDMNYPASSPQMKTLHYKQDRIHDFAWFADKRYNVLKGEVLLPFTNRKVTTWALFLNDRLSYWAKSLDYLSDATFFYSQWVGEYAYNEVTAVEGALGAGGGMEYPTITIIGEANSDFRLDQLITHEVGHNWFYGMLATNERDHAWMDEGINTYYEYRYLQRKYPARRMIDQYLGFKLANFFDLYQYNLKYELDLGYQFMARENYDQAIEQTSSKFTTLNYDIIVYGKTALLFDYMRAYLGISKFDKIMQKYFDEWKFKHPQPEDLRQVFEGETGKDLNWFFDDLLKTTKKIDYKLATVKKENGDMLVTVKNVNRVASPVSVSLLQKDSVLYNKWIDGFYGAQTDTFPYYPQATKVQIDPLLDIPEINRKNNIYKLNRLAHKFEKLRLQLIGSIEDQNRTQIFIAPYVAWNNYDKTQVGLAFYGPFIPNRKFDYALVPAFGAGSKKFIGLGKIGYHIYPEKVQSINIAIEGKRFSYLQFPQPLMFDKIEPSVNIELKKKDPRSYFTNSFKLRNVNVWLGQLSPENNGFGPEHQYYYVNEVSYKLEGNLTLCPFTVSMNAQQSANFVNLYTEDNFMIGYRHKGQGLRIRLYAVGIPVRKASDDLSPPLSRIYLSDVTVPNTATPVYQRDYTFDENFIDRNGENNILDRQVAIAQGGFRSISELSTNRFLVSTNITTTIYQYVPFDPFFSLAEVVDDNNKVETAAELGISLVVIRNMIELNLPILATNNIVENQQQLNINKWYQRITFTLKINFPAPGKLLSTLM